MSRRDPLLVAGVVVLLLLLLLVSVLGRMFVFLRFVSTLLLVAVAVFAIIAGYRLHSRGEPR
ncbi:MAG TPA: hypothetical protein VKU60_15495 [Chloroflexota bacterium]|nr:hypothetical protein [Chloroflexota bacterium]